MVLVALTGRFGDHAARDRGERGNAARGWWLFGIELGQG